MLHRSIKHCRGRTILMRRQNVTAGCLNFAKSHFAIPDSGVAWLWQNFNNLLSILPPWQNNPVGAVKPPSWQFVGSGSYTIFANTPSKYPSESIQRKLKNIIYRKLHYAFNSVSPSKGMNTQVGNNQHPQRVSVAASNVNAKDRCQLCILSYGFCEQVQQSFERSRGNPEVTGVHLFQPLRFD